jgi:predicted porin
MNKKLLAVAVAGALAAPGIAFAQAASVTITGAFKVGLENLSYSGVPSNTRLNNSQMRVVDNSSLIIFQMVEPLGNGLDAIAKLDVRFAPDQNSNNAAGTPSSSSASIGSGNTWVGLRSATLGSVTLGRWDLHYNVSPGHADTAGSAAALGSDNVALLAFMSNGLHGNQAIANATRTQNVVKWDSPTWGGFNAIIAWSANPIGSGLVGGSEGDMTIVPGGVAVGTTTGVAGLITNSRKGDGWNINPSYTNGPFQVGYSFWKAKADAPTIQLNAAGAPTAISFDQRGDMVYGYYKFGGFKVGAAWNRSRLDAPFGVAGVVDGGAKVALRDAWSVPLSFTFGPNTIMGHYTRANKIKSDVAAVDTDNTGAKMYQLAYLYEFSKRTSVGLTYSKISNDSNANYNLFTSAALGSQDASVQAVATPILIQSTVRHAF